MNRSNKDAEMRKTNEKAKNSAQDSILSWNAMQVSNWFENNGFSGYSQNIVDNDIDGEVLINMANETLADLGIKELGTRLLILKRIYAVKEQCGMPIDPDTFIPLVKQSHTTPNTFVNSRLNYSENQIAAINSKRLKEKRFGTSMSNPSTSESEPFKSFKIGLDHTCLKVLPLALKKYNINDDFRNYKLSIRTVNQGNKVEHVLEYDEKPLEIFQKLKDKGLQPIFVLKRVRNGSALERKQPQLKHDLAM